ncbi:MAG TPA: hypothetical protein EYG71_07525 [Leucothrix sp.]|nr:hypothetical protein [Leucothrix sp.]
MKLITYIFTAIGLVVTFMVASLFFTRYELMELNQNHRALYATQTKNIGFDAWLNDTQAALGSAQRTLLQLNDLSFLIYPSQKTEVKGLIEDYQKLLNQHAQLLNILELEIESSPSFKKIWEVTFLDNASGSGVEVTQKLFANLPELISELQKNRGIIENQQAVIEQAKLLATSLNFILEDNQEISEAFMLGSIMPLADDTWLVVEGREYSTDKQATINNTEPAKVVEPKIIEPKVVTPEAAPISIETKKDVVEDKSIMPPAIKVPATKEITSEKQVSEPVKPVELQSPVTPAKDVKTELKVIPDIEFKPSTDKVEDPATLKLQPAPEKKPEQLPTESMDKREPLIGASLV